MYTLALIHIEKRGLTLAMTSGLRAHTNGQTETVTRQGGSDPIERDPELDSRQHRPKAAPYILVDHIAPTLKGRPPDAKYPSLVCPPQEERVRVGDRLSSTSSSSVAASEG